MLSYTSAPVIVSAVLLFVSVLVWRFSMDQYLRFLNSLATPGGNIVVLFILLLIGWRMFQVDATAGGSIMTLSSGAILTLAGGKKREDDHPPPVQPPPAPPAPILVPEPPPVIEGHP